MKIELNIPDRKAANYAWLLGLRYGKRKSLKTMISMAVTEIVAEQANKVNAAIRADLNIPDIETVPLKED